MVGAHHKLATERECLSTHQLWKLHKLVVSLRLHQMQLMRSYRPCCCERTLRARGPGLTLAVVTDFELVEYAIAHRRERTTHGSSERME